VLITPFHNMMLICPATTAGHVQALLTAFDDVLVQLGSGAAS
jgi:glutamate-1-semialdehyde 2,1-aminomutase